ncbi:MAG TPA: bifunctional ornithine acetyltransferase/N-acetylglutamate synthase, partial [Chloroflexota bacterium]|nr:bifunctional ornithine acetyltransferase/N-acetylglutamate synthase [Chloroflexota bacterium]
MNNIVNGSVTSPAGFTAVAVPTGLKKDNQPDLALVVSERDCVCAAMFTQNQVVAAPVIVDRETLAQNKTAIRAVVANAKNANACTGEPGLANARETQRLAAAALGIQPDQV